MPDTAGMSLEFVGAALVDGISVVVVVVGVSVVVVVGTGVVALGSRVVVGTGVVVGAARPQYPSQSIACWVALKAQSGPRSQTPGVTSIQVQPSRWYTYHKSCTHAHRDNKTTAKKWVRGGG